MKKTSFALLGAIIVAACSPVSGPSDKGLSASFKNEQSTAYVAGQQPVSVRVDNAGKGVPAVCAIDSQKFSTAQFKAPATVNLPAYSNGAVPVKLTCTYEDETFEKTFAPENLSAKARTGSAIGVALLCPICGVGVAAANSGKNKDNDIYGFTELEIEL